MCGTKHGVGIDTLEVLRGEFAPAEGRNNMSDKSAIQWTDATWNPIAGCTKCSPGCSNCYAEKWSNKLAKWGQEKYQKVINAHGMWNGDVYFSKKDLEQPEKWKKPRRVFVNSMSDTFHLDVKFTWIDDIMAEIDYCSQHTFIILTKRPRNALCYDGYADIESTDGTGNLETSNWEWPQNVWLGTTVCTQKEVDKINYLLEIPTVKVKFISVEPMLEQIVIPEEKLKELQWVIIGCESGPGAREVDNKLISNLILDCMKFDIPVFLKQIKVNGKLIKNPNVNGKNWNQFPIE